MALNGFRKECPVIVTSAPGKVILHGEHAVVHGKTAIAASLGLRTCVRLSEDCGDDDVHFIVPDIFDVDCHWSAKELKQLSGEIGCTADPTAPTEEQVNAIRHFIHSNSKGHMPDVCAIETILRSKTILFGVIVVDIPESQ
jgi:mevalonate kinase